ncbi:MAG: 3,4-dihydroxy-2-butanone-4-phosphate synthase [Sphingobium sp.]
MTEYNGIASIETIIEAARNGRPYILVDAEDRENEGDVIIPAQFATPENINFLAKHARGLICLAMTQGRADQMNLAPMAANNEAGYGTAFTVSIEARVGVTTGISAHDRAHTIAVAIDPTKGADDIVSPGHVFPLIAREGGVLVRTGHTEAAVDISRLAGLQPAGVICEIMNDDGTMARLPDLLVFAARHEMPIGTIADLIAYRRRTERSVDRVLEKPFESAHGLFQMIIFREILTGTEHVALVKGRIDPDRPVMVRVHQITMASDILHHIDARHDYIPRALEAITAFDGPGIAVFIRDPNPAWISQRHAGLAEAEAERISLRDYGTGAQILRDLGVQQMILLTSSPAKLAAVKGYGLNIVERRPVPSAPVLSPLSS